VRVKTGEVLAEMPLTAKRSLEAVELEFKNHLEGSRCTLFQIQQFWHDGCLSDPANVLFLQVDGNRYLRFFFDAGDFFCRSVEFPDIAEDFDDRWGSTRLVEPQDVQLFVGHDVTSVHFFEIDGEKKGELRILFSSGAEFRLTSHVTNNADWSEVSVVPAGAA
jgi:hypothetical protein